MSLLLERQLGAARGHDSSLSLMQVGGQRASLSMSDRSTAAGTADTVQAPPAHQPHLHACAGALSRIMQARTGEAWIVTVKSPE
jgi:hypothetical protein